MDMSKQELKAAISELTARGYTHICSVMCSADDRQLNYGLVFLREGVKFYLNGDTYKHLPE
jgi:hypothetical protein